MDRYYAILTRSLASVGREDAAARQFVYSHLRNELDRLIDSAEPRMPTSDQIAHKSALEQAIAQFEEDFAGRQTTPGPTGADPAGPGAVAGAPAASSSASPADIDPSYWADNQADNDRGLDSAYDDGPEAGGGAVADLLNRPYAKPVAAVAVLAVLAVAGYLIYGAFGGADSGGGNRSARQAQGEATTVLVSGASTDGVKAAGNTEIAAADGSGTAAIRISSKVKKTNANGKAKAAQIALDKSIIGQLPSNTLRATVMAKSSDDNPSPEFAFAIIDGKTSTDWKAFSPTDEFLSYTIEFDFDEDVGNNTMIAIWADTEGGGRAIDVSEVSVEVVPN